MIISRPINKSIDELLNDRATAYMKAVNKNELRITFDEALEEIRKSYDATGKSIRRAE